jgi:hypothetical protein
MQKQEKTGNFKIRNLNFVCIQNSGLECRVLARDLSSVFIDKTAARSNLNVDFISLHVGPEAKTKFSFRLGRLGGYNKLCTFFFGLGELNRSGGAQCSVHSLNSAQIFWVSTLISNETGKTEI